MADQAAGVCVVSLIALLSLATYRVTRLIVSDTIWHVWRTRLHAFILGTKKHSVWRDKLQELISCPYCISVWVAAALVAVTDQYTSVPLPVAAWGAVAAGALVTWRWVEE